MLRILVKTPDTHPAARRRYLRLYIPPLLLIVLGFVLFSSSGRDDSYITYWPARSLALHGEILNYNGAKIEQSSSLFDVILLALLHLITRVDIELIAPLLAIFAGAASVLATHRLGKRIDPKFAGGASLLVATTVYFIYGSFSGLEVTLASLAILLLILSYGDYLTLEKPASAAQFGLIIGSTFMFLLVRPEMPIVLLSVLPIMILLVKLKRFRPFEIRRFRVLVLIAGALTAALIGFRFVYFGSVMPEPVLAKAGGSLVQSAERGASYLLQCILGNNVDVDWFHHFPVRLLPIVLANLAVVATVIIGIGLSASTLLRAKAINIHGLLAMLFVFAYFGFILFSGGDWMEGGRLIAPILPVCMIFAAVALVSAARSHWGHRTLLTSLVLCQLGFAVYFARDESTGVPIWNAINSYQNFGREYRAADFNWFERTNKIHMRDIPVIQALKQITQDVARYTHRRVVVMSAQMGMVAYHLTTDQYGKVYLLDLDGLISPDFMHCSAIPNLSKQSMGTVVSYPVYFQYWDQITSRCHIPKPDVILDLRTWGADLIEQHGYRIVYEQTGSLNSGRTWFHGLEVPADEFIAVREHLLPGVQPIVPNKLWFDGISVTPAAHI